MTSLTLTQGGPRPAELPPTLQPNAIAAMAPRTDRRIAAGFSALSYALLGGTMVLAAALHPKVHLRPVPPHQPVDLTVYDKPVPAVLTPEVARPAGGGGGAAKGEAKAVVEEQVRVPDAVVPDTPVGVSTANHSERGFHTAPDGTGDGTSKDPAPASGAKGTGEGIGPGTGVVELTTAQVHVLTAVNPVYPAMARLGRIQGPVELLMTIDPQGVPTEVKVLSGHPAFHAEAQRAARLWRFEPARVGGQAVSATFRLSISFRLN